MVMLTVKVGPQPKAGLSIELIFEDELSKKSPK